LEPPDPDFASLGEVTWEYSESKVLQKLTTIKGQKGLQMHLGCLSTLTTSTRFLDDIVTSIS